MEAKAKRKIKSGYEYAHLFPEANLQEETVKKGATVSDTVKFIPKVVDSTLEQTEKIAKILRGNNLYETCKNIWDFVYHYINYQKDEEGLEQIRSPGRSWHDRYRGVDCDCYTVFISSVLTNLKIPHLLRIVKYSKDYFQHIYPVVPTARGDTLIVDCVVDRFNYEEPYKEKKDTTMDLQYLSGTDEKEMLAELDGENEQDELGRRERKKRKGGFFRKLLHITNKLNPATVLLRNGVLAAMKLNLFKIAQRLKYAYLSDEEARKRGVDMAKFERLKKVKEKLENIFYSAGGKPENFKKAILKGKGNKNREVSLEGFDPSETELSGLSEEMTLTQLLGDEIYHSENPEPIGTGVEGMEGFGELGEPATGAAIATATSALVAIAGILKSIGNIMPKKEKGAQDFENADKAESNTSSSDGGTEIKSAASSSSDSTAAASTDIATAKTENKSTEDKSGTDTGSGEEDNSKKGFWDKNKKWLKPTLFGVGGLGVLYAGYRLLTSNKNQQQSMKQLSGIKSKKAKKGKHKKNAVALM